MITGYLLPREQWPKCLLPYKEVKEIWVSGCKLGYEFPITVASFVAAHAHSYGGIICTPWHFMLNSKSLMLHELAHILVGCGHAHDQIWENKYCELTGMGKIAYSLSPYFDLWALIGAFVVGGESMLRAIGKMQPHLLSTTK
jgi:hypothetical protein